MGLLRIGDVTSRWTDVRGARRGDSSRPRKRGSAPGWRPYLRDATALNRSVRCDDSICVGLVLTEKEPSGTCRGSSPDRTGGGKLRVVDLEASARWEGAVQGPAVSCRSPIGNDHRATSRLAGMEPSQSALS